MLTLGLILQVLGLFTLNAYIFIPRMMENIATAYMSLCSIFAAGN